MPLPGAINRHLTGSFDHGLCASPCLDPFECCFAFACFPWAVVTQRRRILEITGEPYIMCSGLWPCCGFEKPKPLLCLFVEGLCCPAHALAANRFLIQTRFNKKNTGCENFLRIGNLCVACQCCLPRVFGCCSKEKEMLMKSATCIPICAHCQNALVISQVSKSRAYIAPKQEVIAELPDHFAQAGIRLEYAPVQQPLLQ